jgi:hypothetical protein
MRTGEFFYVPPGHDSWVLGDGALRLAAHHRRRELRRLSAHRDRHGPGHVHRIGQARALLAHGPGVHVCRARPHGHHRLEVAAPELHAPLDDLGVGDREAIAELALEAPMAGRDRLLRVLGVAG